MAFVETFRNKNTQSMRKLRAACVTTIFSTRLRTLFLKKKRTNWILNNRKGGTFQGDSSALVLMHSSANKICSYPTHKKS